MRTAKRFMALCLSLLILMMSAAQAEVPFLMHSKGWNLDSIPLDVMLKADVETHMPFDDDRLAMLKLLTDLMSLRLVTGPDEGLVTIGIADQDALTLQYHGDQAQLSCMPGVTYSDDHDPLSALLGEETSFPGFYDVLHLSPEGESLLIHGRELMEKIPQAFEANGRKSKNNINISGYGKAAYIIDFSIAAGKTNAMQETLISICPDGWLKRIISELTFSGKQSLRVYFSEEDIILRIEYNGACGPKNNQRTVKLVWKLRHDAEVDKDYIELTSPAKKGKDKNNLTFERTISTNKKGAQTIVGSFKYTRTKDAITEIWNGEYNLSNAYTEDADVLGGDFMIQTRLGGDDNYKTTIIAPSLIIKGIEEAPDITGTIAITEKYATRVTEQVTLTVGLKRAEQLAWSPTERVVDLSAMDEAALNATREDVAESIATALVRPLIWALGAENEYFFRDLPEDVVQSIIDAASAAVNEPREAE